MHFVANLISPSIFINKCTSKNDNCPGQQTTADLAAFHHSTVHAYSRPLPSRRPEVLLPRLAGPPPGAVGNRKLFCPDRPSVSASAAQAQWSSGGVVGGEEEAATEVGAGPRRWRRRGWVGLPRGSAGDLVLREGAWGRWWPSGRGTACVFAAWEPCWQVRGARTTDGAWRARGSA